MSTHVIYYKDGAKVMRPVLSREEYMQLRDSKKQKAILKAVREGEEKQKHRLVQMNYSCLPNEDGTLRGSTRMSSTIGMDIDHIAKEEMDAVRERILNKKEELGLLMLEKSARGEGYHLVFKRRQELSQEDNLRWASELLEVEYDAGAKDITRVFFTTTAEDLLYLDDGVFEVSEVEGQEAKAEGLRSKAEGLRSKDEGQEAKAEGEPETPKASVAEPSEVSLSAFDLCVEQAGLKPTEMDVWGVHNWHANLMAVLSVGVAKLMSHEQLCAVVALRLPNYSKTEDCQNLIKYFYEKYDADKGFMNTALREINAKAQRALNVNVNENDNDDDNASMPPVMPKKLPKVVQLLVSKTPDIYKPAVAHAIFPALGAHLWKVRFPYIDNVKHEATFMNVLMAGTGAGKDCISQPINHIMADIRQRDAENLKREAEWKKEVNAKGANKDKRQRPEGLVIQEVDPDMTNPAFVMRMAEADEHFLYTKMNEIDQFDALRGSARGSQQFQIMCLAFDPDNRYGQTRVGSQSVTEKVCIRFNWNAATTIQKGQRYFSRVLTDGPISRINFCTIPEREIGAEMPVYGTYDASFDEELRPYIDRLCRAAGVVDCPQAFRLAKRLKDECAEFARLSQSRVYENLSFRANVIAYLKACVLYICNDYKWSREIEDFVRWSLNYDLWCKIQFFGAAIENANRGAEEQPKRGPRNLLEQLPDEFSVHDADLIRQANGMNTRGTRNMLSQWVHRGYVLQMTDDSFKKVHNSQF